jgi:hypothetical protein
VPPVTTTTILQLVHLPTKLKTFHLPYGPILMGLACMLGLGLVMVLIASQLHRGRTAADLLAPGLYGVVGRMGGGKSYFLALAAFSALGKKRLVYANYRVEGAIMYQSWGELLGLPHCEAEGCLLGNGTCPDRNRGPMILMDEVHLWFPSEAWKCPVEVTGFLSQLRKLRVTMLWASQHEAHVGKRLIRLSFGMWKCVHYRQGHQYTLFDAVGYNTAKAEKLARMNVVRKADVMRLYDTNEVVNASVEWGDGAGFENLSVTRPAGPAQPRPTVSRANGGGAVGPFVLLRVPDRSTEKSA